jgi:hypothetical protein
MFGVGGGLRLAGPLWIARPFSQRTTSARISTRPLASAASRVGKSCPPIAGDPLAGDGPISNPPVADVTDEQGPQSRSGWLSSSFG